MPTLDETQKLLWTLITAPEGAAAGLAALPPPAQAVARTLVRADARLSAIERVDIYADMYFYRIRDALKEDFATVAAVLGDAGFHNLITDYLLAYPPSHFSLRYAGEHLPAFLATHAAATQWPYVADLAELEWAILDAFDAPDAPAIDAAVLRGVPQEDWPSLRFTLTPSLRQLRLAWTVHETWQQAQRGEPLGAPLEDETLLQVWRQDLRVFHRRTEVVENAALTAVAQGAPFADVCDLIVARAGAAGGVERAAGLVAEWLRDGLLADVTFE